MAIEKSAGAVIFREENNKIYYLLLHYQAGHWGFPKGNIEKGEKAETAAKREVFEETGIKDIEFVSGFKETIKYFYKRDGKSFLKFVTFFLAETKTQKVKISLEHTGYQWLVHQQALKQLTFLNAKQTLRKARIFTKAVMDKKEK